MYTSFTHWSTLTNNNEHIDEQTNKQNIHDQIVCTLLCEYISFFLTVAIKIVAHRLKKKEREKKRQKIENKKRKEIKFDHQDVMKGHITASTSYN